VLARRAAAEIAAGDEDCRTAYIRVIQNEFRARPAVFVVTPVSEKVLAQSFFRRRRQETRRNDLVGVDVVERQYDGP
jgi:hypothetical protein